MFSADTQDDGFWYEIRGFGDGLPGTSWQVREGFVESLDTLENILWEDEYRDRDDNLYHVQFGFIDAMGHRTAEVYEWCTKHRGKVLPIQGKQTLPAPYAFTNLEFYPGGKKPLPGGLQLVRLNTTYYKNKLVSKFQIGQGEPGSWNFNSDTSDRWLQMMLSEYLNEYGVYEEVSGAENHGFDVSGYLLAAHDYFGVAAWPQPDLNKNNTSTKK